MPEFSDSNIVTMVLGAVRDVASGVNRHLDITFGFHIVDSSSLVSVLFREAFSHPYISFFHSLVNGFSVTSSINFKIFSKYQFRRDSSMIRLQMLTKFISIGSYSPEVRAFGTLITSTKVFRLIIRKTL